MFFANLPFLYIFLPLVLLVYYFVPVKAKNGCLFFASLLFFAWCEPLYLPFLLINLVTGYEAGLLMSRWEERPTWRRATFWATISLHVLLFFLLYWGVPALRLHNLPVGIQLAAPVGVAFYTLRSISYVVDVYRKRVPVQKKLFTYGAYMALFFKMGGGAIVRYEQAEKLLTKRISRLDRVSEGMVFFCRGLGKKVLLADQLAPLWTQIQTIPQNELPAVTAWLGILAFTFQFYFTLSGISDMAGGIGRMFGFVFNGNFNLPYTATSMDDFWKRWMITLSSWLNQYVFFPLGGNSGGKLRHSAVLLLFCLLSGAWYGFGTSYLAWGIYSAVLLLGEQFLWGRYLEKFPRLLRQMITMILVIFGWVIMAMGTPTLTIGFFGALFGRGGFAGGSSWYLLSNYGVLLLLCFWGSGDIPSKLTGYLAEKRPFALRAFRPIMVVALLVLSTVYLVG